MEGQRGCLRIFRNILQDAIQFLQFVVLLLQYGAWMVSRFCNHFCARDFFGTLLAVYRKPTITTYAGSIGYALLRDVRAFVTAKSAAAIRAKEKSVVLRSVFHLLAFLYDRWLKK